MQRLREGERHSRRNRSGVNERRDSATVICTSDCDDTFLSFLEIVFLIPMPSITLIFAALTLW